MNKRNLEFTDQELNIIIYCLRKQSHELVDELIKNIVSQINSVNEVKTKEIKNE